jgi:hypothetical protein
MRRVASCASALLALVVGAVQPLAAQANPLSIFVGPLRQWTFSQCQTGRIPNADRTGGTTGQQFCVDGTLTLGARRPEQVAPGVTVAPISWIAQLRESAAPGVSLLGLDLDAPPSLEYRRGAVTTFAQSGLGGALNRTVLLSTSDCLGTGCGSATSLDAFTPISLRLIYEYYLDVPCGRPAIGCPPIFEPPQTGIVITGFQAVTVTPEPSTYALLGTGLLTLGGIAARERRRAQG